MKKKTYNPFKMWGSYVGAFVGLLGGILTDGGQRCDISGETGRRICEWSYNWFGLIPFSGIGNISKIVIMFILPIIVLFLLGWGIHSLIRRLKK